MFPLILCFPKARPQSLELKAPRRRQGCPKRGAGPLPVAASVPSRPAGIGSLRPEALTVDVESRVLHVARLKQGLSTTHPLRADELRLIKA
jgi:hypothetical protein